MIELKHLGKTYSSASGSVEALKDISLTISDGEIFGIIGLSGAGKSTLVRCINLLERPTSGEVWVDGQNLTALGRKELLQVRRQIGMIFQGFNLLEQRTVLRNVCFPLEIGGTPKAEAKKRAEELLAIVGLAEKAANYPSQLSGGQKQRVAIAGVIAMQPQCIVLDEPTAMLDPQGRREVLETVERLNREHGITVILITHHMDEAVRAGRVIAMSGGRIIADGTPHEVFAQAELLKSVGLDVPQTEQLLLELRRRGIDIPADALTPESCAQLLCARLTKKSS